MRMPTCLSVCVHAPSSCCTEQEKTTCDCAEPQIKKSAPHTPEFIPGYTERTDLIPKKTLWTRLLNHLVSSVREPVLSLSQCVECDNESDYNLLSTSAGCQLLCLISGQRLLITLTNLERWHLHCLHLLPYISVIAGGHLCFTVTRLSRQLNPSKLQRRAEKWC